MKWTVFGLLAALACGTLCAQGVDIQAAWVRTSVPGQQATGAFMTLVAREDVQLVAAFSPVAALTELHEMKMVGDVMTMRAIPGGLALPAGQAVELRPGGHHLMLMDLKAALPRGRLVALTLVFKNARGERSQVELQVPVAAVAPGRQAAEPVDRPRH